LLVLVASHSVGRATSGGDPYSVPDVVNTSSDPNVVETTITAQAATVDIGNGVTARAYTYNGSIPGPTFRLRVGQTVIVHFHNNLSVPTGVHWHGIDTPNEIDGTPFTQNQVAPGGSFLYKFKVDRPGIFWYHPHHHSSTNQVFKGLYGMIVVTDPNEAPLQAAKILPSASQTKQLALADTTVCKAAGTNDTATYAPGSPWIGGALPAQAGPTPKTLCESPTAVDENGNLRPSYAAGDIPAIQQNSGSRENEGQTVLTNGKNVGTSSINVQPGQGLRLQILNASAIRYMRLRLSPTANGTVVPLFRVGGEGGLLNNAVEEGGLIAGFDTKYIQGEILIPPGSRADVVAPIPTSPGTLTLWTEDFSRTGLGFTDIPTVPVMNLNVTGATVTPAYSITDGTPIRGATGDMVPTFGSPTTTLLNPASFSPPKLGMSNQTIALQAANPILKVDGVFGTHDTSNYMTAAHLGSTRYARVGDTLQLAVTNATGADHPFHLHGFPIQPLTLTSGATTYTFPTEIRDNVDIPPGYTLAFLVKLTDRAKADGVTPGGALGRWMFHCHMFFHATLGMLSELVVLPANGAGASGKERPDVNVNTGDLNVQPGQTASTTGTYFDVDGEHVTLSSSVGTVHDNGGGNYSWSLATGRTTRSQLVYISATNQDGTKSEIPFSLHINDLGAPALRLPGTKSVPSGTPLTFGISATDPDAGDLITFTARGLPAGLRLVDHGNRTATVSGTVTARKGKYSVTFAATDGHTNPTTGRLQIKVGPRPEFTGDIAQPDRLSGGKIKIGCHYLHKSIRRCTASVFVGKRKVGQATKTFGSGGKKTTTLSLKLSKAFVKQVGGSVEGVPITVKLDGRTFGSRKRFPATVITTVVASKSTTSFSGFTTGGATLSNRALSFLIEVASAVGSVKRVTCTGHPDPHSKNLGLARARGGVACSALQTDGLRARFAANGSVRPANARVDLTIVR
jgi:FtsP/CotA-like multicopper oxidase with cupredoxin domain